MENQTYSIASLHSEIVEWKELVMLVRDEIAIFEHQLGELLSSPQEMSVMQFAQHFESQFIRHKEVSDELFHDLKIADHNLKVALEKNPDLESVDGLNHFALRDRAITYEKLFNELKSNYRHFLAAALS
ncbi:MAG: hypothetical protein KA954_08530 [Chitinophagales bacterium]|nr:hypothetical protein [Bacteroidota bacterium]MBP7399619.1 hypothetical protein [Chitinophagales bacterium]MBP8754061.1 hypothetical protein [Chitinophagales bacterium]MBP9189870.1 hypothetical protein [Chitinophagales bacterium]MBP9547750.1 hypothetical protein [Chitinophagales bacterium]